MSNEPLQLNQAVTASGVAALHKNVGGPAFLVGAAVSKEFNTLIAGLLPIACWKVDDLRFDFDSSLVIPEMKEELTHLATLVQQHPGAPLSVFGHADASGDDTYNKTLSGRRAQAIYALLTRKTALWDELYNQPFGHDNWKIRAEQTMLRGLGFDTVVNGKLDEPTQKMLKVFQVNNGLAASGQPDAPTRKKLFEKYMDALCGPALKLSEKDFLARGRDPGGKGDFQGCSEFNPLLIFSQAENQVLQKPENHPERNLQNASNRRVMVLLFRKGSEVLPAKWPCPRVKEGTSACRKRFWSDAEKRRNPQAARREFAKTQDTFACRFYDRLLHKSPCESRILVAIGSWDLEKVESVPGEPPPGIEPVNPQPESTEILRTSTEKDLE